jgi:hypothetical protein
MTIEKNRILITRYFEEVWNQGKLDVLDEIIDINLGMLQPARSDLFVFLT